MVKNTGEGSSMINSTTDPVRSLILPSCEEIKTSVSLAIFRNLIVFDGVNNFSGYSGIDLVRTAASLFSKMTRSMLRGIRVSSKEELKERISQYIGGMNETPTIFKWKYKMDKMAGGIVVDNHRGILIS
jgi:hypothetical protein